MAAETGTGPGAQPATEKREPGPDEILTARDLLGRGLNGIPVLIVLVVALSLATDSFLTLNNLDNLARQMSIYAIIAMGQLLVILTRGIDLSVGSVVGLSGVIAAITVFETSGGLPVVWAVVLALLVSAAVGAVNGLLVAVLKMPPFIVTLGFMGIARGLTLLLSGGRTVQPLPEEFSAIANGSILGITNLFWVTLVVLVVLSFALHRTVWGRYVYAVGSSPESARLAGVPVNAVQISVFTLSGLLAGVAGVLLASRLSNGVPTAGTSYELDAIAACVIGGASLFGARGTALGAFLGALIVGILNNGGTLLGIDPFYLQIAIGALILVAVAMDQLQAIRARNRPDPDPEQGPGADPPGAEAAAR
ncbi:ABC transporter permease [Allonocardiopsis opalescens]|uniref:Monosaccharide ABC transporter membrane protein (CUT2 family) n=1 Tax=Allonocardiopsis opalescens TaxID=1144618 RepID=A0A2T0Q0F7_9ACTN|nr:ABC transporter permease [Allonocardiopsis opalescens]PRX97268.1 monosaccharide ABC transporter membrane protein (CUT2 family) [Allonocardiopsis opalescens]